jgi:hypothetical protein
MWWKYYVHMHVGREMRHVKTISGIRGAKDKGE